MKNYFLANFRMHNFKSSGYRKLANVHKSMQIGTPFVQKNKKNCFLYKFLGKITSPQTVFSQFPIFITIWPSLIYCISPYIYAYVCTMYYTVQRIYTLCCLYLHIYPPLYIYICMYYVLYCTVNIYPLLSISTYIIYMYVLCIIQWIYALCCLYLRVYIPYIWLPAINHIRPTAAVL